MKVASWSRLRYPKNVERYSFLQFFGNNVVASEFDEWKLYRRIVAPAFSDVSRTSSPLELCRCIQSIDVLTA